MQRANLPSWLVQRLQNLSTAGAHYEASFGGPHNTLLNLIFPAAHSFMVKPIPRLQALASPPSTPNTTRTSIDSYNRPVVTRNKDHVPDFVVVKATGGLHNDRLLLIWELKRDDADASNTTSQIDRYLLWARDYQAFLLTQGEVPAVLVGRVEQGVVTLYSLQGDEFVTGIIGNLDGDLIMNELLSLAAENMQ